MLGRETYSSLRDAADRVNAAGYETQELVTQLKTLQPQAADALEAWENAGHLVTVAACVIAVCAVIGLGVFAYSVREG